MKRKHKRLTFIALGMLFLAGAAALVLTALGDTVVYFHSPTEIAERQKTGTLVESQRLRLGGLVETDSVKTDEDGLTVNFQVTDGLHTVDVAYRGILPDLFREGQGVVTTGFMKDGRFHAEEVLAKHDENYMPPEVAEALKKSGHWEEMEEAMKKDLQEKAQ